MTLKRLQRASIHVNSMCIVINTTSGYSTSIRDDKGSEFLFSREVSTAELGKALRDALDMSRWVLPDDVEVPDGVAIDCELYDRDLILKRHVAWKERLRNFCGCAKTKLFKPMYMIDVELSDKKIILIPYKQVKVEAWEEVDSHAEINVDISNSDDELGRAIIKTLDNCESKFQA